MTQIIKVTPGYVKNLIAEEREILLRHDRWKKILIAEGYRMHSEGYSSNQINESLWQMAKAFGLKFWQSIKHDIADWIMRQLGFDTDKYLAKLIANMVEEMDLLHLPKYFGSNGCREVSGLLIRAMSEVAVEGPIDGFMDGLGINPSSKIYITLRERLESGFLDGTIPQAISDTIEGWVCGVNVSEIVDALSGSPEFPELEAAE